MPQCYFNPARLILVLPVNGYLCFGQPDPCGGLCTA